MPDASVVEGLQLKYLALFEDLVERGRRRWAATEAIALRRGGTVAVATATGLPDRTVKNGIHEIKSAMVGLSGRQRKSGGGRKPLEYHQANLVHAVEKLVEPFELGDPQSPLRWTCKSLTNLQSELDSQGFQIGRTKIGKSGRKIRTGKSGQENQAGKSGRKIRQENQAGKSGTGDVG